MEIIATTSGNGFLIQASDSEVKEILNAVTGKKPEKIEIGQKIPAIDYATTITKIKSLGEHYDFKELSRHLDAFQKHFNSLVMGVEQASKIEL
jgi:hypothetical protein